MRSDLGETFSLLTVSPHDVRRLLLDGMNRVRMMQRSSAIAEATGSEKFGVDRFGLAWRALGAKSCAQGHPGVLVGGRSLAASSQVLAWLRRVGHLPILRPGAWH
eukprot:899019-Pyramimonas_sp.AAC.1